jgi:adenine phosphoribosyltransferase
VDELTELITAKIRDIPDYPQPGVIFKDITPLLADGKAFNAVVDGLAGSYDGVGARGSGGWLPPVDKVVGIEARGFILAAPVACRLGAGFVPVRKKGKLPGPVFAEDYELEYGTATIEVHQDAFAPGDRVLIVDDVLATGGTAAATAALVRRSGAAVAAIVVMIELSFLHGRDKLSDLPVTSLLVVLPGVSEGWPPEPEGRRGVVPPGESTGNDMPVIWRSTLPKYAGGFTGYSGAYRFLQHS